MGGDTSRSRSCLVVLRFSILLTVLSHVYLHFYWVIYDMPISGVRAFLLESQGYDPIYELSSKILWFYIFSWYAALAGMFALINWARWFYLVIVGVGFVSTYVSGMQVATPGEAIVMDLISMLSGVIVAIAFFSPVASTFAQRGVFGLKGH